MNVQYILALYSGYTQVELAEQFVVYVAGLWLVQLDHVVESAVEPSESVKHFYFVDIYVVVVSSLVDVDWRLVALCFLVLVAQLQIQLADSS